MPGTQITAQASSAEGVQAKHTTNAKLSTRRGRNLTIRVYLPGIALARLTPVTGGMCPRLPLCGRPPHTDAPSQEESPMADADTTTPQQTVEPPLLSPAAHAVLDYAVAGAYLLVGVALLSRHRRAGVLALANGAMICAVSMMTNYPGGVWPRVSFKTHRTLDLVQASLAGVGPYVLGFGDQPAASYFFDQAASEMAIIAATDWDGIAAARPATGLGG